ncbi:MAG: DUF1592 domain-containing protein [Sandaracinaceae bacterium]
MRSLAWRVGLVLSVAALGCQGQVAAPSGTRGDPGARCDPNSQEVGSVPLRRLSRMEFQNAVRDLLYGTTVVDAPVIPADVSEHGFENVAAQLSAPRLLVERYELTATELAEAAMADVTTRDRIVGCVSGATPSECTEAFLDGFGRRAFRRPMTDDERADFRAFIEDVAIRIDFDAAIELAVSAMIQSPQFTYRLERGVDGVASPFEMASRLSFFLWQSIPDDALLDAAAAGELATPGEVEMQARRMLDDPRARAAAIDFHRQWLDFDRVTREPKNAEMFPDWSEDLRAAIREESDRFVGDVVWDGDPTLATLLTSRATYVNADLAAHYGVAPVGEWTRVELPEGERSGILTRAGFLAGRSHETNGSPVLRGAFVIDRMLCRELGSPPDDADTSPVVPPAGTGPRTNRQLFEERTGSMVCQGCHRQIDGIGYGFEHYDSTGAYRDLDQGLPVDATGNLVATDVDGPYDGAVEISERLAQSETVRSCVARSWVRYTLGRATTGEDACFVQRAEDSLRATGGDLRELMVTIVTSPQFARGLMP